MPNLAEGNGNSIDATPMTSVFLLRITNVPLPGLFSYSSLTIRDQFSPLVSDTGYA